MTAGSSNTGLIHAASSAASARMTTVMIELAATPIAATTSPSGVFASLPASLSALTAQGSLRFMMLPVMKPRYAEQPMIGV